MVQVKNFFVNYRRRFNIDEVFAEMSEEGFMIMFDLVSCDPKDLNEKKRQSRDIIFDVLWNNGEEWNRV